MKSVHIDALVGSFLTIRLVRNAAEIRQPYYPSATTAHISLAAARSDVRRRQRMRLADTELILIVHVHMNVPRSDAAPDVVRPLHVAPKTTVGHGAEVALLFEDGAVQTIGLFPAGYAGTAHRWALERSGPGVLAVLEEAHAIDGVVHSSGGTASWSQDRVPHPNGRMTVLMVWGPRFAAPVILTADPVNGVWDGPDFGVRGGDALRSKADRWILVPYPFAPTTPEFVVYGNDGLALVQGEADAILATEFGDLLDRDDLVVLPIGASERAGDYGSVRRLR